jgi:transposase
MIGLVQGLKIFICTEATDMRRGFDGLGGVTSGLMELQILELLRALRGKQRERINPDQLLLFEIGELEQLIEEQQEEAAARPARRKKKHGRRLIPDGHPEEVIEYTVPEEERLCPVEGMPMPQIRWEESKQLDYIPPQMKAIVHRRAVYACLEKHDEATLVTAPCFLSLTNTF